MKTKHTPEETPTISVHIPDYDTRFTYSLKMGDICAFDDGNRLELADRAQLTDLVSVVNGCLINFNRLKREHDELVEALQDELGALGIWACASGLPNDVYDGIQISRSKIKSLLTKLKG